MEIVLMLKVVVMVMIIILIPYRYQHALIHFISVDYMPRVSSTVRWC